MSYMQNAQQKINKQLYGICLFFYGHLKMLLGRFASVNQLSSYEADLVGIQRLTQPTTQVV